MVALSRSPRPPIRQIEKREKGTRAREKEQTIAESERAVAVYIIRGSWETVREQRENPFTAFSPSFFRCPLSLSPFDATSLRWVLSQGHKPPTRKIPSPPVLRGGRGRRRKYSGKDDEATGFGAAARQDILQKIILCECSSCVNEIALSGARVFRETTIFFSFSSPPVYPPSAPALKSSFRRRYNAVLTRRRVKIKVYQDEGGPNACWGIYRSFKMNENRGEVKNWRLLIVLWACRVWKINSGKLAFNFCLFYFGSIYAYENIQLSS